MNEVEEYLTGFTPEVGAVFHRTWRFLLELVPDAYQTFQGGDLGIGTGPGYKGLLFTLTPYKDRVRLGIARGASLPDPHGLMLGTGKVHRHVRLESLADADRPELRSLLKAARALADQTKEADRG